MRESTLILMLQLVKNNGSIESIVRRGYSYTQIANFIKQLIIDGWVINDNGLLKLSDEGNEKFNVINKKLNRNNSSSWISPQEEYKVDGITKFDVYLPRK